MKFFQRFRKDESGFVDVGVGISIGILFAGLMVIAYIIWTLRGQLITTSSPSQLNNSIGNITGGFDNMIMLLLIVVTIWLLALAIMALLIIKKNWLEIMKLQKIFPPWLIPWVV